MGCGRIALVLLAVLLLASGLVVWRVYRALSAKAYAPVVLTPPEQTALDAKVRWAEATAQGKAAPAPLAVEPDAAPTPAQLPASRRLVLTEKELNALADRPEAKELQGRLRFAFEEGAVRASANVPVPTGVPLLGGKNVRISARVEGSFQNGVPRLVVTSATLGGVEVPNAWVNQLKGRDLGAEHLAKPEAAPGVAKFLAGVESITVHADRIEILLKP
jgi:hypothetical protein